MQSQILFSSGSPKSTLRYWVGVVLAALPLSYLLFFQIVILRAFIMRGHFKSVLLCTFVFPAVLAGVYGIFLIFREVLRSKNIPGLIMTANEIELRLLNRKNRKLQIRDIKEVSCSKLPMSIGQVGWFLFVTNSGKKYFVLSKDFDRALEVLLSLQVPVRQTQWVAWVFSLWIVTYISALFLPTLMNAVGISFLIALIYALASRKALHFHLITKEMETAVICGFVFAILLGGSLLVASQGAKDRQRLAKHPEISRDVANSKGK